MLYTQYKDLLSKFQQDGKEALEDIVENQNTDVDCNMSEMFDYYANTTNDFNILLDCWDIHF